MQVTNHESDFDRRVFAAYMLTAVAFLLLVIRIDVFANFASTLGQAGGFNAAAYSWLDKLAYAARGSEFIGFALLAAAYLLMLDSDDEPKAMKVAIWLTALMSLVLAVSTVLSIGHEFKSQDALVSVGNSSRLEAICDFLAAAVLAFSALALTWPVISDIAGSKPPAPADAETPGALEIGDEVQSDEA